MKTVTFVVCFRIFQNGPCNYLPKPPPPKKNGYFLGGLTLYPRHKAKKSRSHNALGRMSTGRCRKPLSAACGHHTLHTAQGETSRLPLVPALQRNGPPTNGRKSTTVKWDFQSKEESTATVSHSNSSAPGSQSLPSSNEGHDHNRRSQKWGGGRNKRAGGRRRGKLTVTSTLSLPQAQSKEVWQSKCFGLCYNSKIYGKQMKKCRRLVTRAGPGGGGGQSNALRLKMTCPTR